MGQGKVQKLQLTRIASDKERYLGYSSCDALSIRSTRPTNGDCSTGVQVSSGHASDSQRRRPESPDTAHLFATSLHLTSERRTSTESRLRKILLQALQLALSFAATGVMRSSLSPR